MSTKRARTTSTPPAGGPIALVEVPVVDPVAGGDAAPPVGAVDALAVELMPLSAIKPYANNPRRNEAAIAKVAESIRSAGFRQPIVVDEQMVILVGHTRRLAAMQLGLTKVPVHVARGLSPAAARAYRLSDNRTAQDALWDDDALRVELEAIDAEGTDLASTGFDPEEFAALLGRTTVAKFAAEPDEAPPLPKTPVARPGELYQLGIHRLLCGDARVSADWARLMGDDRADAVITDPPYDVNIEGRTKAKLKILNDNLGHVGTVKLLRASLSLALAHSRDGAAVYVWAPHGPSFLAFAQVATEQGWWHQTIVWVKDSFVLGRSDYHGRHEAILAGSKVAIVSEETPVHEVQVLGYGWKPAAAHTWSGDRRQDTAWECPRPRRSSEHPTMKPVTLIERAIRNSTAQGATVVDMFAGSGTALIASEAAGRRCLAMELDPGYVDVILARFTLLTGQKPARIEDPARRG